MKKAVYAGSFDPFTKGHCDIVEQSLKVFDEVEIGIGANPAKQRFFQDLQAKSFIEQSMALRGWLDRVSVTLFDGALMHFAEAVGAAAVIRGLRQVSDFNDEFTQHGINTRISDLAITYFICRTEFLHVSSSTAKMMASLGLDTSWLVDTHVKEALDARFPQ